MNKTITRTFVKNTIKVVEMFIENGQPQQKELPDLVLTGALNREQIEKAVRKEHKGKTVLVLSTKKDEEVYTMPVSLFIEVAENYAKEQDELSKQSEAKEETKEEK